MAKKATDTQMAAYDAVHELCRQLSRAIWLTAKAEGLPAEDRGHADVLLEWYDAVTAMREDMERKWPGVNAHHRLK